MKLLEIKSLKVQLIIDDRYDHGKKCSYAHAKSC